MAIESNETPPETVESADTEYLDLDGIMIHVDAVEGIARDVAESLPFEVGGLLMGTIERGERPVVRIERYQRIPCNHSSGTGFILGPEDSPGLEAAASEAMASGQSVLGLYRSHTRPVFQLEASDWDLIYHYFRNPTDLVLLIDPLPSGEMAGQFYSHAGAGPVFPFRGRTVAGRRRLVPDFVPEPVEPAQPRDESPESEPTARHLPHVQPLETPLLGLQRLKSWWPLPAAALVVGVVLWLLLNPGDSARNNPVPAAKSSLPARPLGLFVDPVGENWRVSWNSNASALQDARGVQLFVRAGDDQQRIELSPRDLSTGTYEYKPKAGDVTFRLEVTEASGRVSAESFRFTHADAAAAAASAANTAPPAPAPEAPGGLRAVHKVAPQVPAKIRPRIKGVVPVDIRVRVNRRGHVISAVPVGKKRTGLELYLVGRAQSAARAWRFENGPGEQTLHFVFQK